MQYEEYFIMEHFKDVDAALTLFKDDPFAHKPGKE
jgi:hypothetical protein